MGDEGDGDYKKKKVLIIEGEIFCSGVGGGEGGDGSGDKKRK